MRLTQPLWATRSLALGQLAPLSLYSPDPRQIFSGIVVCFSKLTPHDVDVLSSAVRALGGGVKQTLCADVTHLVATTRDSSKMRALAEHPDVDVVAVAPHWINDSFRLSRLLPLDDYVFDRHDTTSLPVCLRASYDVPARAAPSAPAASQPAEMPSTSALQDKRVLLARDIHGGSLESLPQLHSLRDRIEAAGGICAPILAAEAPRAEVMAAVAHADVVVARYRGQLEVRCALEQHRPVGTLAWLVKVLATGQMSAPRDRLLHFPFPREPVAGFPSLTITLTNYTGQARTYLKELIAKMGGVFTPEMTPANSVCVALELRGEKVAKAREWNIPVVNHLWLESCFATWRNQHLAQEQFITFPGAAQLLAVVGHASVAEDSITPYLEPATPSPGDAAAEAAAPAEPASAWETADAAEAPLPLDDLLPDEALEAPVRAAPADDVDERPDVGGQAGEEPGSETSPPRDADGRAGPIERDSRAEPSGDNVGETAEASEASEAAEAAKAVEAAKADKGSDASPCNGADDHDTGVQDADDVRAEAKESAAAPSAHGDDTTLTAAPTTPAKRAAPTAARPSSKRHDARPVLATTSVELTAHEEAVLETLGVRITDDLREATHLVAKSLTRTEKMLCAIAQGLEIVGMAWVRAMVQRREIIDAAPYALRDKKKEQQWSLRLADVLATSRARPARLLEGHHFYLTKHVQPARDVLTRIVEAAGGHASLAPAKPRDTHWAPTSHLIACDEDAKLAAQWQAAAAKADAPCRIYTPELILAGVLRQSMDWSDTHRWTGAAP